jgi:hypothetical protein
VQPVLGPADVDHRRLLSRLHQTYAGVFCVEIPGKEDLTATRADLEHSLKFMEGEGLFSYFS